MHSLLFDMLRVVQVYLHDIKMQDASFEWDTLKNTLWAIHWPSNKTLCQMVQLSFFISFLKYKTYTNETIDDKKITLERHCGKNWVQKTSFLDIHRQYYFIMCPFFLNWLFCIAYEWVVDAKPNYYSFSVASFFVVVVAAAGIRTSFISSYTHISYSRVLNF